MDHSARATPAAHGVRPEAETTALLISVPAIPAAAAATTSNPRSDFPAPPPRLPGGAARGTAGPPRPARNSRTAGPPSPSTPSPAVVAAPRPPAVPPRGVAAPRVAADRCPATVGGDPREPPRRKREQVPNDRVGARRAQREIRISTRGTPAGVVAAELPLLRRPFEPGCEFGQEGRRVGRRRGVGRRIAPRVRRGCRRAAGEGIQGGCGREGVGCRRG